MQKQIAYATRAVVLAGVLLVVALSGFSAPGGAESSKIAFTRATGQTESTIYVMNSDGSDQVNLMEGQSDFNAYPAWSPDAEQIAFISDRDGGNWELYVMDADGSNSTRITDTTAKEFAPVWSPDGLHIAYQIEAATPEIHVIEADGMNDVFVINGTWPSWSPDGAQLLITYGDDWSAQGLGIINTDGTGLEAIPIDLPNASEGAWSPDGKYIAFVSNLESYDLPPGEWNEEIYVVNLDGSNLTRLTERSGNDHWPPSWSPDSAQLAFTGDGEFTGSMADADDGIYIVSLDGSELIRLTDEAGYDAFPAWQP